MLRTRGECAARALAWLAIASCGQADEPAPFVIPDECAAMPDRVLCSGDTALHCVEGRVEKREDCRTRALLCAGDYGCRACVPGETTCDGSKRYRCSADGSARELVEECAAELSCAPGGCRDLCLEAARDASYLGCDYWPVFTVNRQLASPFVPAVTIGNGNLVSARITIERAGEPPRELELAPRSSQTVELAFDARLKNAQSSQLVRGGAYHLRASVPVTVHQFNPLTFSVPGDCPEKDEDPRPNDGFCYSHTNDASLLLPTSALAPVGGESHVSFVAVGWPSFFLRREGPGGTSSIPGVLTVVALGSAPVHVSIQSAAFTIASPGGSDAIAALAPGDLLERTMMPGDVLQLLSATPATCDGSESAVESVYFCNTGRAYDLTGTTVRADGPVQVIAGHDCANVPFDRPACDHLEESLPPTRAWGTSAIVTKPRVPDRSGSIIRVISGAEPNLVTFDPPINAPVEIGPFQFVELPAMEPVHVVGTKPLLVAQLLVGQGLIGNVGGDPSLTFAAPIDQYRRRYNFVSPATYSSNYVDVIAKVGDVVHLDGVLVRNFTPVGASGLAVATVQLQRPGAHELTGEQGRGLGVVLYGTASYTSYMLPGGLDLKPIAPQGF
jgi:hypothetical protein